MEALRLLVVVVWLLGSAAGLVLDVRIHYPEVSSAYDACGFTLRVATPLSDEELPPAATRRGRDLFAARLVLPDQHLYAQTSIGIMASINTSKIGTQECVAYCEHIGPQGLLVQTGAYHHTEPLRPHNYVDLWPSFCKYRGSNWSSNNITFKSHAINKSVSVIARVPGAFVENPLPRPADRLPPVMFRFNGEWYWPDNAQGYTTLHELMVSGLMESVVVAEIYVEGLTQESWSNQPIFTEQKLNKDCVCTSELQFICDSWHKSGYNGYAGGDHHFAAGALFMDELYDLGLPQVLKALPTVVGDRKGLRVGAWGYCIGGLAAWTALTSRPNRFNLAYLGSPAMDFDCGAPFDSVKNLSWGAHMGSRPRVYIDAGAAEGELMDRQTLLLMRRLQERGAVEGKDIFYERAEFGTHQGRSLLRRSLRGLLVLFGTGSTISYVPVLRNQDVSEFFDQQVGQGMGPHTVAAIILSFGLLSGLGVFAFVALQSRSTAREQQGLWRRLPDGDGHKC